METQDEKTIILWLAETLVTAVPKNLMPQDLRHWSNPRLCDQLRLQVHDLISRTCLSEWWQRFQHALVAIEPEDNTNLNERRYPLEKRTILHSQDITRVVHICKFKEFVDDTDKAVRILKHRGKRPATLREVLEYLQWKQRKAWAGVEHWQCRIYIMKTPVTDDITYGVRHHCLEIQLLENPLPSAEPFMAREVQVDGQHSLRPRDWCFVVNL